MSALFSPIAGTLGVGPSLMHTADVDGVVMSILLTNNHYGTLPVKVWLKRGPDITMIVPGTRIRAKQNLPGTKGDKVAIMLDDEIWGECPVPGVVDFLMSAYRDE